MANPDSIILFVLYLLFFPPNGTCRWSKYRSGDNTTILFLGQVVVSQRFGIDQCDSFTIMKLPGKMGDTIVCAIFTDLFDGRAVLNFRISLARNFFGPRFNTRIADN